MQEIYPVYLAITLIVTGCMLAWLAWRNRNIRAARLKHLRALRLARTENGS